MYIELHICTFIVLSFAGFGSCTSFPDTLNRQLRLNAQFNLDHGNNIGLTIQFLFSRVSSPNLKQTKALNVLKTVV